MFLTAQVEDVWDATKKHMDYATFKDGVEEDNGLTGRISMIALRLQRAILERQHKKRSIYSLDESLRRTVASGFLTIIASILPVLPTIVLYFVDRPLVRIFLILLFTIIFATALVFGLGLRSDTVLAITTA